MATIPSVATALTLLENDKSKALGLTTGGHQVTPGQTIPKAGKCNDIAISLYAHAWNTSIDAPFRCAITAGARFRWPCWHIYRHWA